MKAERPTVFSEAVRSGPVFGPVSFSGCSEETKPVQPLRELDINSSRLCIAQQINELHGARTGGDGFWVWNLVIDNPLGPIRRVIHYEDMAPLSRRVPDVPPVKNKAAMNAF